jgi:hypothetical protein
MAYYPEDIAEFKCDEASKHIIRMAREMNTDSLVDNTPSYEHTSISKWDCSNYVHVCPYRFLLTPRSHSDWAENDHWLFCVRKILYDGVIRNKGWQHCYRCNPKGLKPEDFRKEIAARKIMRYLRRKVPIIKFKRSTTVYANLHIRRGLPADVVGKILSS